MKMEQVFCVNALTSFMLLAVDCLLSLSFFSISFVIRCNKCKSNGQKEENVKSPVLSSLRFQCNLVGVHPLCDTKNVFSAFVCFMHMNIMESYEMIHLKYILRFTLGFTILIMQRILHQKQQQHTQKSAQRSNFMW